MELISNSVRIKSYFFALEQRFDANEIKELIGAGGLDISKSFARAIGSENQLKKYKKTVDKDTLIAFLKGVSIRENCDFESLFKAIQESESKEEIVKVYREFSGTSQ